MCPEQLIGYGRRARALRQFTVECINDVSNTNRPSGTGGLLGDAPAFTHSHTLSLSPKGGWDGGSDEAGEDGGGTDGDGLVDQTDIVSSHFHIYNYI